MAMLAAAVLAVSLQSAAAANVCLRVKDIKNSDAAKDGTSITFTMNDGKVYRNDLGGRCNDLQFNGFAWTVRSDEVCDNETGIRVLQSGQICKLGKFTQVTPAPRG
jgi:hypothetical protein